MFLIWTGTKNGLEQFSKNLNKKHPSIKFDCKASKTRIVFLDTEIIYITANYTQRYIEKKLIETFT